MQDYNFFAQYEKTIAPKKGISFVAITAVAFAVLFASFGILELNYMYQRKAFEDYAEIVTQQSNSQEVQNLKMMYEEAEQHYTILQNHYERMQNINIALDGADVVNKSFLLDIAEVMPKDIKVRVWNMDRTAIYLQGAGENRESVAEFLHNLGKLPFVDVAFIHSLVKNADQEVYNFVINCSVKEVITIGQLEQ